jgi:hypothetical protein
MYKEAVRDCGEALQLDPANIKALYRQAQAHKELKVRLSDEQEMQCIYIVCTCFSILFDLCSFCPSGLQSLRGRSKQLAEG